MNLRQARLTSILLMSTVIIAACSSVEVQKQSDATATASQPSARMTTADAEEVHRSGYASTATRRSSGRPLWIWIAPDYQDELPAGTGEYIVESL